MRRLLPAALAVVAASAAHADDLTLRRAMLSTGGIGYFEYDAHVAGDATLRLDVKRSEIDDVLASLLVFDDAGQVGGAELPGEDGGRAAFQGVPFGPGAFGSALAYLNALQGVTLEVRGPRPMTGTLLHAEQVTEPAPPPAQAVRHTRVTLLTATGLQQFVLEDAESVQVQDPALRDRVAAALAALRGASAGDRKALTLHVAGGRARTVRVGYVAAVPLWKTTYRVVLPENLSYGARFQAWAVVENQTGADWNGVDLSLQYGNPITFRQALYRAYYAERPEVPVEILGRVLPPGMPARVIAQTRALALAAPAPVAAAAEAKSFDLAAAAEAPVTTETVAATVFHLPAPVTLAAGHTADLPILDIAVPAMRLDVVQQGRAHALDSIRIINGAAISLPAGMLTLYESTPQTGFVGNALLTGLPPGARRILSFGEDLHVGVDWRDEASTLLVGVAAAQGVLHITRRERQTSHVTLTAAEDGPHLALIELPRVPGTTLTADDGTEPEPGEGPVWHVPVVLLPGATRTMVLHVDRLVEQAVVIADDPAVLAEVLNEQALEPAARAALQHVADLRADLTARRAEANRLREAQVTVERDEDRIRRNLAAVPPADALYLRLVRALDADETHLAGLATQIVAADDAARQAQAALAAAVAALQI